MSARVLTSEHQQCECVCTRTLVHFSVLLGTETRLLKSPVCDVVSPRCFPFPWKPLPSAIRCFECVSLCVSERERNILISGI